MQNLRSLALVATALLATACAPAAEPEGEHTATTEQALGSGLVVHFEDCVESIGVTLAATDGVRARVPAPFVVVGEGTPVTPLVVRTARCRKIAIGNQAGRPAIVVQIGAVIVPPGVPGDIDNFTLGYATNDARLALALGLTGVSARVARIDEDLTPHADGSADLDVDVGPTSDPKLSLHGSVVPSTTNAGSFHANWWAGKGNRRIEMSTNVPAIAIGGANLTMTLDGDGAWDELFGGATVAFPLVQQWNRFAAADMTVTVD